MQAKNVILVEDDPDDRDLFVAFFAKRKDVRLLPILGNGLELIDYLNSVNSAREFPHLIVLDQNMPKMNGKQTLRFLQGHDRYSQIPVVLYSTHTDTSLIVDCKMLGARLVAAKPIDEEGYQKMMDDFLQVI